jgi:hypothetical protein
MQNACAVGAQALKLVIAGKHSALAESKSLSEIKIAV